MIRSRDFSLFLLALVTISISLLSLNTTNVSAQSNQNNLTIYPQFNVYNIPVHGNPYQAIYDPSNGYLYVTEPSSCSVLVLSGTKIIANITITPITIDYTKVRPNPYYGVYDPSNGYVYIIDYQAVTIISGTKIIANFPLGFSLANAVYDPLNGYIYITSYGVSSIYVINGTKLIATIPIASPSKYAIYDPANGYIYVADWGSHYVSVISRTSVIATIPVISNPHYLVYDPINGYIYVIGSLYSNNNDVISVISGTKVIANITVGEVPVYAVYDPSNGYVYVTNAWSHTVSVISGTKVIANIFVGGRPYYLVYDPSDGYIYVSNNYIYNYVTVISGTTVLANITIAYPSNYLIFDPADGYVYALQYWYNCISVIEEIPCYVITFIENGLPQGTLWSITLNGTTVYSTTNEITFVRSNGTYYYTVGLVPDYSPTPSSGIVKVNGNNVTVYITFKRLSYSITFVALNLPSNASWTVIINGTAMTSTSNEINITLPAGSYYFNIIPPKGYNVSPSKGIINLDKNVKISIEFIPIITNVKSITSSSATNTLTSSIAPPPPTSPSSLSNNITIPFNLSTVSSLTTNPIFWLFVILLIPELIIFIYRYKS